MASDLHKSLFDNGRPSLLGSKSLFSEKDSLFSQSFPGGLAPRSSSSNLKKVHWHQPSSTKQASADVPGRISKQEPAISRRSTIATPSSSAGANKLATTSDSLVKPSALKPSNLKPSSARSSTANTSAPSPLPAKAKESGPTKKKRPVGKGYEALNLHGCKCHAAERARGGGLEFGNKDGQPDGGFYRFFNGYWPRVEGRPWAFDGVIDP
ncbi:MAG: hypothetical protein M1828_002060 [Chrysothrix sp. TS-e1954]|nr:MAG: hypothetical protein M1828_002060 [Chrysothrix sp. TS-e1954]